MSETWKRNGSLWTRDAATIEIIRYFDEPERRSQWDKLSRKENQVILGELEKCRKDFSYAARNYFWIVDKSGEDIAFKLWESQELILEKWYWMRRNFPTRAQKIMILKARQLGAIDPNSRVLRADLTWVPIGSLDVGDEVIAVDEYPAGGRGVGRLFRTAKILNKWIVKKEAYRLTMSDGRSIIATGDHPFLCKIRGSVSTQWRKVNDKEKGEKSSSPIRLGDQIRVVGSPWGFTPDFEDGWFAGLLDGEGSLRAKNNGGIELSVSQVDGYVLQRAIRYLKWRCVPYRMECDTRKSGESSKLGNQPVYKLVINSMPEVFRLLGICRPSRFQDMQVWDGKDLPSTGQSWVTVMEIEDLGEREMVDIETTTKTFIAEGMITHNCSTVIEGLIAWSTIFFSNRNALVVSHNDSHAAYLFSIMLHIYDHLPWWLQPMYASRKQDTGLFLANPDLEDRRERPGNNSLISVQSAAQISGVGQGMRLNSVHCSEYADWDQNRFKEIIDGDLIHAIADNINSFAFLESTGKGSGTPAEQMWVSQVELAERGEAEWLPLFIPAFFEKTRVMAPPQGWHPDQPEIDIQERVMRDWVRCSNGSCLEYYEAVFRQESRTGKRCPQCSAGMLDPVVLSNEQLRFMQLKRLNAEGKGLDAVKKLKEELAVTAEEAWQLSGIQVFPPNCQNFVNACVDHSPMIWGNIDDRGKLHYVKDYSTGKCALEGCLADHRWDTEHPLQIWELPDPNFKYSIGVDVAEGLGGKADFSVVFVNKWSPNGRAPDEQVALWRSNTVNPIAFASPINWLGRLYNEALVSIEVNKYDSCFNTVRMQYLYPNLFVWKHYDSKNPISNKMGWVTNLRSKPMLWQTAVRWIGARMWIVKSDYFLQEMKKFQKDDYDDVRASAETNFHDDVIMAGMIALFCAHDLDYSEDVEFISPQNKANMVSSGEWINLCTRCQGKFETENNPARSCKFCRSMMITSHRNVGTGQSILAEDWPTSLPEGEEAA